MLAKLLGVSFLAAAARADTQTNQCHQHLSEGIHFDLTSLASQSFTGTDFDNTKLTWNYCNASPSMTYKKSGGSDVNVSLAPIG